MSRSKNKKGFSFDMPPDLYDFLKTYSEENDIKIAQIIRVLLRQFVDDHQPKEVK